MLHHNPRPPLVRFFRELWFSVYNPARYLYARLFHPTLHGAKTGIFFENQILLVRIGYSGKWWALPGGGIEKGETGAHAAIRETKEETGVTLTSVMPVATRVYDQGYKIDSIQYFYAEATTPDIVIDDQEIVDAGWFPLDALPTKVTDRLRDEITMIQQWIHERRP